MLSIIFLILYSLCLSYSEEECNRNFSIRKNAIILTKSSQAKGAVFIHKQVISMFPDCYALCCSNRDCTVAVYENKVNHNCYLFNCKQPNVCSFTEHSHYISMMFIKPESKVDIVSHDKYEKSKPDIIKPSVDGKLGDLCGALRKCGPENSMCTSGTCICQLGFIGRNGECVRSMCPKPELMFQCYDVTKMPFCVALYDQCNGLYECGDGSDELHCEEKSNGVSIPPNKTVNGQSQVNTNRNVAHQTSFSDSNKPKVQHKVHLKSNDHLVLEHNNISHKLAEFQKSRNHKLSNSERINPLVENQLLILESKNKLPKYSRSNHNQEKHNRPFTKPQRDADTSSQIYENRRYSKLKTSSYPHLTKIDDYYQKGGSEPTETRNHIKNSESFGSDYDFSQMNLNNRDSSSDWYGDKNSNQYSDNIYQDNNPAKYSNDRNSYLDYTEPDDDNMYSKSRDRFLADTDYYNPNAYYQNSFEKSMYQNKARKNKKERVNRIFVEPKPQSNQNKIHSTSTSGHQKKVNSDDTDIRNSQEWSTAVIILSLGLLITAGLLIAIGIKMRSWRNRLRKGKKGKSLTTDEGDYLINGMYL